MLRIVLLANAGALVLEVVAGLALGSLALLADAGHLLADVAGLGVALVAHRLVNRPATVRHSFGLQRAEVLGAQANGAVLLAGMGWVAVEAIRRLGTTSDVHGPGLLVVATIGLAVNLASAVGLSRAQGSSLNMRGAFLHMAADAVSSLGAMAAGVAVLLGAAWVDAAASLAIAAMVLVAGFRLLRDATHVLLEGTPAGLDPDRVEACLAAEPGVAGIHHLHLWSLASDMPALSAHVVLHGEPSLHEAQTRGDLLRQRLADQFGIEHATLELECHRCGPDDPAGQPGAAVVSPPSGAHAGAEGR